MQEDKPQRDMINDLLDKIDDEAYNLLAKSYSQFSEEMNGILREVAGPNLDEDDLFFARESLIDILDESLFPEAPEPEPGAENEEGALDVVMGMHEGDDGKNISGTRSHYSYWSCYATHSGQWQGNVKIWWGHTSGDAAWACNSWISYCGNNGGCNASPL